MPKVRSSCCNDWKDFIDNWGLTESKLNPLMWKYGSVALSSHCPICGKPAKRSHKKKEKEVQE